MDHCEVNPALGQHFQQRRVQLLPVHLQFDVWKFLAEPPGHLGQNVVGRWFYSAGGSAEDSCAEVLLQPADLLGYRRLGNVESFRCGTEMLGAFQVSTGGDLENWSTGGADAIPAVGGAMDLAIGAKQVYLMMTLFDRDGAPKLVPQCTYPLTAVGCTNRVYTDLAVFDISPGGVIVRETFGITIDELEQRLGLTLTRRPAA